MANPPVKTKSSYDYYLILATSLVLFVISAICIYGMFFFKLAGINEMEAASKALYMHSMNRAVAPFLIILILLLGICVPKRLLPTIWLNRLAAFLVALAAVVWFIWEISAALRVVLFLSLLLQSIVLAMAIAGSRILNFEKKGYWVRVGSSLIHLGLILFVLDLFYHRYHTLHIILFWITTAATTLGMLLCFYADPLVRFFQRGKTIEPSC